MNYLHHWISYIVNSISNTSLNYLHHWITYIVNSISNIHHWFSYIVNKLHHCFINCFSQMIHEQPPGIAECFGKCMEYRPQAISRGLAISSPQAPMFKTYQISRFIQYLCLAHKRVKIKPFSSPPPHLFYLGLYLSRSGKTNAIRKE